MGTEKDHNIGIDMRVAGLSLSVDYYSADTKNMLTDVTIPTSTGFTIVKDNLGLVRNSGVEAKANYTIWQGKEGFVNVYGTFAYNRNKIIRLSESMRAYNEKMMKQAEDNNTSAHVLMYQDGLSMKTIWAVPSAGIDPQTGQEIYIKKMVPTPILIQPMIWSLLVTPILSIVVQAVSQPSIKVSD